MSTLNLEHIKHENSSSNNITVDSDGSVAVNRHTSDGTIIDLQKDGTSVGGIGAFDSDLYIGNSGIAARFDNVLNAVTPFNNNTLSNSDNVIDIGSSARRFKDLYLSGGVYLGGTGAANYLDDYEEGTWTPTISDGLLGTHTPNVREGRYTKIGNAVYAQFYYSWTARTANGSYGITMGGLPFSAANFSIYLNNMVSVNAEGVAWGSGRTSLGGRVASNSSIILFRISGNNISEHSVDGSLSTSTANGYFYGGIVYHTDA